MINTIKEWVLGIRVPSVDEALAIQALTNANEEPVKGKTSPFAELVFRLMPNGDINIRCEWKEEGVHNGNILGEFLWHVSEGHFNEQVRQILTDYALNHTDSQPTVKAALNSWDDMKYSDEHNPLVNPLSVFGATSQIEGES